MLSALDEKRPTGRLFLLSECVGRSAAHLRIDILQRAHEALDDRRTIMLVKRPGGGGAYRRVGIAEPLEQEHGGARAHRFGQLHHCYPPDTRIGIRAAQRHVVEVVVEGIEHGRVPQRRR
jgi:hypothetical protein